MTSMTSKFRPAGLIAAGLILSALVALPAPTRSAESTAPEWIDVDYGDLVDRRRLSHSSESVGELLERLGGRGLPPPGQRPPDLHAHSVLDPLLEPYAFVIPDTLDTLTPGRTLVEVGSLYLPGGAEPAWVELLRSRRFIVESDGAGRMRVAVPFESTNEATSSEAAAKQAWQAAWPVLRHVIAAERKRLSSAKSKVPPVQVTVHPYRHLREITTFRVGTKPFEVTVESTRSDGARPALDTAPWQAFLDSGLWLEGARLEKGGRVLLIGSARGDPPTLLGRRVELSDLAVAYRAVFHGGLAEPYMSLDRGHSPWMSVVNYGGRLRDTALGHVSLVCDVRFKTFSQGYDVLTGEDVRERIRRDVEAFRTHLENFSSNTSSKGQLTQQTRFWFYPDDVDLTLSREGDVLVMRRARMTAASERIQVGASAGGPPALPPWTTATVREINGDYDSLGGAFPELRELDQVVRLLSLFTWLRQAAAEGLNVPDLDSLLAIELPPVPTPRQFPQLLTSNALPPPGSKDTVFAFERADVVQALERMQPASSRPLSARIRFQRGLMALDRNRADHADILKKLDSANLATLDAAEIDRLAHGAERIWMHSLVLDTLAKPNRDMLMDKAKRNEVTRLFSVGTGGLDLGMGSALSRASRSTQRLSLGGAAAGLAARPSAALSGAAVPRAGAARIENPWAASAGAPSPAATVSLPAHQTADAKAAAKGEFSSFGSHWMQSGSVAVDDQRLDWTLLVNDADGPEPRSRLVVRGKSGLARTIERVEENRLLRYSVEVKGPRATTRRLAENVSSPAESLGLVPGREAGTNPWDAAMTRVAGLPLLHFTSAGEAASESLPRAVNLHVHGTSGGEGRDIEGAVPRALLWRVVLGHSADRTPGVALRGFAPLPSPFGEDGRVMILMTREQSLPPWSGVSDSLPGEENAVRVAEALGSWRDSGALETPVPPAVVGTDPVASPRRWQESPKGLKDAVLILPEGAFAADGMRKSIRRSWTGTVATTLPDKPPALVVLASAESPSRLGVRLRALARDDRMEGRTLAVWALAGAVREDLPASLLAEGHLLAIGLSVVSPNGLRDVPADLADLGQAFKSGRASGLRVEELPGGAVWYF